MTPKKRARLPLTTATVKVTYTGIFRVEGGAHPYLYYRVRAQRPDGQVRHIHGAVGIRRADDLQRLQQDFRPGELVEITMQTDWDDPALPTTLLGFEKASDVRSR